MTTPQQFISRFETVTSQLENRAANTLNEALDSAYKEIEAELRKKYPSLANSGSLMVTRDSILRLEKLKGVLQLLNPQSSQELQAEFQKILQLTNEAGDTLATQMTRARAGEDWQVKSGEIPIEAAGFAAANMVAHLNRYSSEFASRATVLVTQGVIQGWGTAKVASLLRNELGIKKGRAEVIARTEVLSSFNQAVVASYDNSGIEYVQVIATGDLRTCGTCVARNLKAYRIRDVSVPFHPRCRCTLMPWSPDWSQNDSWLKRFNETVRNEFTGTLNNGLSAFEKMNGITSPPVAAWTPAELD
jgi:SPP1 gp7 family putative phage head morphogenesis protein